ncbi:MAG TPA: hypothetical protein VKU62_10780, partial [Thermoanaerobaculia bacterium]|nr:hypothetical protein [Thermoanaerobaculia bacterium]
MTPVFFWPTALDIFRLPKTLMFRASAIVLGAVVLLILVRQASEMKFVTRLPATTIAAAAVLWTAVAAAAAMRPAIAIDSFGYVLQSAIFFL